MKCNKANNSLLDYHYKTLSPRREIEVRLHLEECEACSHAFKEIETVLASSQLVAENEPSPFSVQKMINLAKATVKRERREFKLFNFNGSFSAIRAIGLASVFLVTGLLLSKAGFFETLFLGSRNLAARNQQQSAGKNPVELSILVNNYSEGMKAFGNKNYREAAVNLSAALKQFDRLRMREKLLNALATSYKMEGNFIAAAEIYRQLLDEGTSSPARNRVLLANLADCYYKSGNYKEASLIFMKINNQPLQEELLELPEERPANSNNNEILQVGDR